MAKSSFLPRRNKGYFGQKVTKTLFGNSPMKEQTEMQFCGKCQSMTLWVRIKQTDPLSGSRLTSPSRGDFFQCKQCKEVKALLQKGASRPFTW
ncbi:MAG: hypothetical protein A2W52_03485 [Candidatus Taylorbacteria bacterium RIFCSPHIGHO2_02_49_25]|uniref:Uncharacterized protein n=1 Tax=Candidatus Taylorbacteria bacterium RIFCSPHIGHO2_02_49_25 TaxID=1802305 RepID=A0A1G2MG96_9BACT|nr:MAG: hypothetical protein A2W52_03485 [Candidatus Taylorbacteria bacterium RIFCSPHIGHO2_02_49_25]OHA35996.1 MAG: hypothetical protein A2W65_01105 [Candidatus Taylorbacteria bacterium RIFCSPLOWO2_02_50_13]HCB35354.1 hypothetical protein [Candidatus Taylorbacteria bacterium]